MSAGFFTATAMAFSAFSQPITNYLIKHYSMKANAATDLANIFSGTSNFSPVVGAFVADAFCGRFRTLLFGTIAGFLVSDHELTKQVRLINHSFSCVGSPCV
jgi:peptide/histidine transporter 3/4